MKYLILVLPLFLFACESAEVNNEIVRLNEEKAVLKKKAAEKDSVIIMIVQSFNDIEGNLRMVKEKQGLISLNTTGDVESEKSRREKIIEDIQMINTIMEENRKKIREFTRKIDALAQDQRSSSIKIEGLKKMISTLNLMIEDKDAEIGSLKNDLATMNFSLDSLALVYDEQTIVVEDQAMALNTGFYCYGTLKELKEKGVVTKTGGFIGIGKTAKLMEDFNRNYFTKIDITQEGSIDLFSKSARIITNHATESYTFEKDGDTVEKLTITDPIAFWSASKYLVIIVE
ncbi:MAG TPA: hypothetical protein EYM84_08495 [Flavobacteriales bacterium]|nr:hypothetical protein [Flavobacteriales bacterium]HIN40295.1 hypothetical protein [Flavobacteriales bacterium]